MTATTDVTMSAEISPCGLYRYSLTRRWASGPLLCFIMLNPSTADATQDDPTIRRCVGFARREQLPGIEVVNLFALRATDPAALQTAADPVGPGNADIVLDAAQRAARVVAAWGSSVPRKFRDRPVGLLASLAPARPIYCLGKTAAGVPRHPLYVRGDAPFVLLAGQEGPCT